MPTVEDIRAAWAARKESKARMILLGGMLHDLECYVDRRLFFDAAGNIVRRAGGIRGWLRENLPEVAPHYKTLMRYKAMAIKLRQATGLHDPIPTSALLETGIAADGSPKSENSCRNKIEDASDRREEVFVADGENENSCRKEIWIGGKTVEGRGIERCGEVMVRRRMVMEAVLDERRKNTFVAILRILEDELSPERVLCTRRGTYAE